MKRVVLLAVMVVLGADAHAASYSEQLTSMVASDPSVNTNFGLPGFNQSLGALESVTVSIGGVISGSQDSYSENPPIAHPSLVTVISDVQIKFPVSLDLPTTYSATTYDGYTATFENMFSGSISTTEDLAAFTSSEVYYNILGSIYTPQLLSAFSDGSTSLNFTLAETFTYATAVPEPTSLALLCVGLTGVAVARRRSLGNPQ